MGPLPAPPDHESRGRGEDRFATGGSPGIALLPAFRRAEQLKTRRFERVLADWSAPSTPTHVVYPSARHLSPIVRSFVEYLQEPMTPPPWEFTARGP